MITKPLGEIADILISNVDKKSKDNEKEVKLCNFVDVYYNWAITASNEKDFMIATASDAAIDKFALHKGDVAITKDSETRNDIGVATYISEELDNVLLGYHCILIHPNEEIVLGKYLNVVLHSSYAQKYFEANASGSGQRYTLTDTLVKEMPIPLPDINMQRKIGDIPSYIDRKIENNNKINAELESMAKTIYDYWFLQFEFPNEEGKPYKSSGGKMVWNEELKREIPEGWECKTIKDIENNIITGKTPSSKVPEYYNGDIPFITIGDIRGNMYVVSTEQTLSEEGAKTQNNKFIPEGSICVTCIATPGLVGFSVKDSQTNQQINSIVPKNKKNSNYLYFAINEYFEYASGAKTGNTFANMNKEDFSNILLLYNKEMVEKYFDITKDIFDKIKQSLLENEELASLRDFLLPMLMNGQIGFKDGER